MVTGQHRSLLQVAKTWWYTKTYNSLFMISTNKAACGYHLGHLVDSPEIIEDAVHELLDLYNKGKIQPRVDSVWTFEEVSLFKCNILPVWETTTCSNIVFYYRQ